MPSDRAADCGTHHADFVYLASQSPRRRQLLEQLGVPQRLLLPEPHEDAEALEAVLAGEPPRDYVRRVTRLKLVAAVERRQRLALPPAPILCSDTTVALGGRVYGKPADAADAARMLSELAGTEHQVLTAVALAPAEGATDVAAAEVEDVAQETGGADRAEGLAGGGWLALSVSTVRFAPMTRAQIDAYVATGEPMGKAGAYAVQGRAAAYIAHISGSYTGIMGLPLYETAQLLRRLRPSPRY